MKINITIPDNLSEITLEQYQKYYKLVKDNEPSEFVNQKTIEIFCGIELKELVKISYKSIAEISEHLNNLFTVKPKLKPIFNFGKYEFGFIPKLEELSYGEYTNLDIYLNDVDNYHKAMAILYRPIKKKVGNTYEIEEYISADIYADVMKGAPMDVVLGATLFFSSLSNELLNASSHYLEELTHQQKLDLAEKLNFQRNGDGIQASMHLVRAMLQDTIQLQKDPLLSV